MEGMVSQDYPNKNLEAQYDTCTYAGVVLGGIEELSLQIVRLDAPRQPADQVNVDTSSEIKRKTGVPLADIGDKRIGRNALMSNSEKRLCKRP